MKSLILALGITLAGIAASAVAQGKGGGKVPPAPQGVLVDANGKTVGLFYPTLAGVGFPTVVANINGRMVSIQVGPQPQELSPTGEVSYARLAPRGDQRGTSGTLVAFEGLQCTGAAYVRVGSAAFGLIPTLTIADGSGAGVVYVGAVAAVLTPTVSSYLDGQGICAAWPDVVSGPYFPVVDVIQLAPLFAAPYTYR